MVSFQNLGLTAVLSPSRLQFSWPQKNVSSKQKEGNKEMQLAHLSGDTRPALCRLVLQGILGLCGLFWGVGGVQETGFS